MLFDFCMFLSMSEYVYIHTVYIHTSINTVYLEIPKRVDISGILLSLFRMGNYEMTFTCL